VASVGNPRIANAARSIPFILVIVDTSRFTIYIVEAT